MHQEDRYGALQLLHKLNMSHQQSLLIYTESHYYVVLHFRAPLKSH